jgi:hypothetical protein
MATVFHYPKVRDASMPQRIGAMRPDVLFVAYFPLIYWPLRLRLSVSQALSIGRTVRTVLTQLQCGVVSCRVVQREDILDAAFPYIIERVRGNARSAALLDRPVIRDAVRPLALVVASFGTWIVFNAPLIFKILKAAHACPCVL